MALSICDLTLDELTAHLKADGEPGYRAGQIFDWIYKKRSFAWEAMSSLPGALRAKLSLQFPFPDVRQIEMHQSQDGTRKFLFELFDGQRVESVFIPAGKRATLCISSQAGCKFGCGFCASGLGGWKRDLTPGEILGQVLLAKKACADAGEVTHIVFMGVGEPFDNYAHVLKAVRLLNAPEALHIAARRITISTCGVVPGIKRLAGEGLQVELSVSLHASNDALRSSLMPVNRKYPLAELMKTCRAYARDTGRQVTFEYILIKDLTCTEKCADELCKLLQGWLCKINFIACNAVGEFAHKPPSREEIARFQASLQKRGVITTLRMPRGKDIAAACGQLRNAV